MKLNILWKFFNISICTQWSF